MQTKKKCNSYCLKVTLAKKSGNKVIDPSRQTYVTINDVTATVPHVTAECKEQFQNNFLILVSANGLPIKDSDATRGTMHTSVIDFCKTYLDINMQWQASSLYMI